MEGIYQAMDPHYLRKNMHLARCNGLMLPGEAIYLLLQHSCRKQLGRMYIRWSAEVFNGYSLLMLGYQNQSSCRLPNKWCP